MKTQNIYFSLEAQLNKLARHNRQGSYRTKERYYMAMKRFCRFLADTYRLQKLSNAELGIELERRRFGDTDRTWSVAEFNRLLGKALDREDYILAFYLARYAGLRIHECFRVDTAIARQAIREGAITIKGKGGKIRTVPINQQIISALEKCLNSTPPGSKLLVPDNIPTDKAINQLQQFIFLCRADVQDPDSDRTLTFHGLRHTYAAEKYSQLIDEGVSELDAHLTVSRLLGHERADVTNIYLASVKKTNV